MKKVDIIKTKYDYEIKSIVLEYTTFFDNEKIKKLDNYKIYLEQALIVILNNKKLKQGKFLEYIIGEIREYDYIYKELYRNGKIEELSNNTLFLSIIQEYNLEDSDIYSQITQLQNILYTFKDIILLLKYKDLL